MDGPAGSSRSPCSRRWRAPARRRPTDRSWRASTLVSSARSASNARSSNPSTSAGRPIRSCSTGRSCAPRRRFHVTPLRYRIRGGCGLDPRPALGQRRGGIRSCLPGARDRRGRRAGPRQRRRGRPEASSSRLAGSRRTSPTTPSSRPSRCPSRSSASTGTGLADAYERIRRALSSAGPGGTPSPYVEVEVEGGARDAAGDQKVAAQTPPRPGTVPAIGSSCASPPSPTATRSTRIEGGRPVPRSRRQRSGAPHPARRWEPCRGRRAGDRRELARALVAQLEHIARWEQLKALGGHPSRLRDAIRLEHSRRGRPTRPPADRQPLRRGGR